MACNHCCGADQLFDLKNARKSLKRYKKKGPGAITKKLIQYLLDFNQLEGKTLLDIGGGIGAIQWGFLKSGGNRTIDVDASNSYQLVAKEYSEELGYDHSASFVFGDFVESAHEIPYVDFVTMDKVLCCYPDYESLLSEALKKCKTQILITYPLGGSIARFIAAIENLYFRIRKIEFVTYIHSPKEIENFIKSQGFELTKKSISFPWHLQVYTKSS